MPECLYTIKVNINHANVPINICSSVIKKIGSERRIRTSVLRVMSPTSYHCSISLKLASGQGLEPRFTESKSVVLPLDEPEIKLLLTGCIIIYGQPCYCYTIPFGEQELHLHRLFLACNNFMLKAS